MPIIRSKKYNFTVYLEVSCVTPLCLFLKQAGWSCPDLLIIPCCGRTVCPVFCRAIRLSWRETHRGEENR